MKSYIDTKVDLVWTSMVYRHKYVRHCNSIEREIEKINKIKSELGIPKSPAIDKISSISIGSGRNSDSRIIKLISREEELQKELSARRAKVLSIDGYIDQLKVFPSEYTICEYKFLQNHTWYESEDKFHLSRRAMEKRIKRDLKKVLVE